MEGDADLLEIIRACGPGRGLADLLDRGEQKADQDGDNGNYDKEFDQSETATPGAKKRHVHTSFLGREEK
jgi:hypothetical protein